MRKILEKFPSDFNRDDQNDSSGEQENTDGSKPNPFGGEKKKPDFSKKKPGSSKGGDDAPITLRDLKRLVALKSVGDDGDDKSDGEDEDGAEKSETDTGQETNIIKKEPVVQ